MTVPEPAEAVDRAVQDRRRNVPLDVGAEVGEAGNCRWHVVRHLADGGFSSVYEVRPATPETEERYGPDRRALKCLWGTPAELSEVNSEADKMLAVDGHDNVLALVSSFRFDLADRPYAHYVGLVLELAEEDLYRFGERVSPPERAWVAVFEHLAAGLEHIHARRMVHGDIKPTNLLRVGATFTIADFGVSAPLETTRSAGIGLARTIAFWPPESGNQGELGADGVRRPPSEGWRATQAGDVWALAVSMHRLLTGRHITTGTTPEQQYELVCAGRYTVDDRLGPGLRRLLTECLVHDLEQRVVTTAADMRRRLAELAVSEDYRSVPWTQGEPRPVALLDGVAEDQTLVLYGTQDGGRIQGRFVPRGETVLDMARHLHRVVVPSLAQQVRDSQRTAVRLAEEQERLREAATRAEAANGDAKTRLLREAEVERTRQLSVTVAEVTRQRDQAARDRDRAARDRDHAMRRLDALVLERDRLARQYSELSLRLDRLERDRAAGRAAPLPHVVAVPQERPRRRSAGAKLAWGLLTLAVGGFIGCLLASHILYDDAWSIFSQAVQAVSETLRRH